jgi:hypothetical protein
MDWIGVEIRARLKPPVDELVARCGTKWRVPKERGCQLVPASPEAHTVELEYILVYTITIAKESLKAEALVV